MTTVEIDEDAANGLTAVVVAVVEILIDALEREAIRRMESGRLTDEEVERLGRHLATLEADLESLKEDQGVDEQVDKLRTDLDSLVTDAVHQVEREQRTRSADDGRRSGTPETDSPDVDGGSAQEGTDERR